MAVREGGVFATVVHYLLYATVALLLVDVFVDVGSRVPLFSLALVVATGFAVLAIGRAVRIESGGEIANKIGRESGDNHLDKLRRTVAKRRITFESVRDPRPANGGRVVPVVLLGLLVVGGGLRLYALGSQSFWFDEAISTNAAIALLETGSPTFPSGETYWRAFPHTLVAAGSMLVFGTGEAAARLPSVVFGVATIGVTYWLGRDVGGWRVGLLAAVMVTFATWEIAWSRQARMYAFFQLLFVLALVLLLRVERSWFGDRWAVVGVVVVGLLAAATHQIGLVLLPVAVAYLGIVGAIDGRLTTRAAGGLVAGAVGVALLAALVGLSVLDALASVFDTDVSYWESYFEWFVDEFHAFVLLAVVGAILPFYRGWWRAGLLLVLATGPALWVLSFHTELFATRYLYFALPVGFVWVGVAVDFAALGFVKWVRRLFERRVEIGGIASRVPGRWPVTNGALITGIGLVTLLALGGGFTVVPQADYELGVNAPQPEFHGAYEYVNEHREDGDVIVAGWTAPGVYYAGGVDYWLEHELTGREGDWTFGGSERYSGAEPVRDVEELESVIGEHERGWIVLDEIALARQSPEVRAELEAIETHRSDSVYVFYWNRG